MFMTEVKTKIETLEAEIEAKKNELTELRRAMPKLRVPDLELKDSSGNLLTLRQMFGQYKDLIVIHNMGQACSYCTLWADGLNGLVPHLLSRSALYLVSQDEPEAMRAFAESRGWKFPLASAFGSNFSETMEFGKDGDSTDPGFSTLRLNDDGTIDRLSYAHFGPGDDYCGIWFMLPLLQDGIAGWSPKHVDVR
jgi:predicted dithiol-disulfide oxidoreductase (DUF899 family)